MVRVRVVGEELRQAAARAAPGLQPFKELRQCPRVVARVV